MLKNYQTRWLYEADKGDNGGTTEPPTADGADVDNKPEPGTQPITFTAEQQTHIDAIINRAKAKWASDAEAKQKAKQDAAERDAEAKRLEEEKEYQKLLDLERGKVAELEPLSGQLEAATTTIEEYRATVGEILTAKIEALGEAAQTAIDNLPGEPDELAQLKWLNANEALFNAQQPAPPKGGTPPRGRIPQRQPAPNQQPPAQPQAPLIKF